MTDPRPLLTIYDVAERIGCSRMHVLRLISIGALEAVDINTTGRHRFRITEEALSAYIDSAKFEAEV